MTIPHDPAAPQGSDDSSAADSASAGASETVPAAPEPAPTERPRPAFGEYAPEGWAWQPPTAADTPGQDPAAAAASPHTQPAGTAAPQFGSNLPGGAPSAQPPGAANARPRTVAGVPHNLGVGQQRPGTQQPFTPPANVQGPTSDQTPPVAPVKKRRGDRIATIVLLVLGALGALNFAAALLILPQTFALMAEAFEIADWTAPASLATIGTVGVFVVLGLYAVVLIYSVQRMRRGKLAFLVPLIGGVIALIVVLVIMGIATSQAPELFAEASPERLQKMLDLLSQQP